MKGRLLERPLEMLFRDLTARSSSGVLTLTKGSAKKQICFVKGIVRFAASNLREDRLGEYLVRSWTLPAEVIRGVESRLEPGRRLSEALVAAGEIDDEELHAEVRAHILDIVVPCFEWREGEYRFEEGVPNIVGEITADIPTVEFAIERWRRKVSGPEVEKVLSDRDRSMRLSYGSRADLSRLKLTPSENLILERAEAGSTLTEALSQSPDEEYELGQAAATLVATGILSLESGPAGTRFGARVAGAFASDAPTVPAEVRYYRQMHDLLMGADHYRMLSVQHSADAEEVRRAYYQLAKEIHPDRFLAPPLNVLHHDMEELFTQVLEAYNTLVDPDARARYDAERAAGGSAVKEAVTDQLALARQNYLRGRALFEEGKMAEALKFLQNAVEIEPKRADFRRLLGTVQARNPRMRREAEENFLVAIELDPARPDAYLQLGLLYRRLGETSRAAEKLRECLKWDPTNAEAGAALAEIGG